MEGHVIMLRHVCGGKHVEEHVMILGQVCGEVCGETREDVCAQHKCRLLQQCCKWMLLRNLKMFRGKEPQELGIYKWKNKQEL